MTDVLWYHNHAINHAWLTQEVLATYPSHKSSRKLVEKIETLVLEYLKFWHLMVQRPEKRIVAPGPIIAVQDVHSSNREIYFQDCMQYFNTYHSKRDMIWGGLPDIEGTIDTVDMYAEVYTQQMSEPWSDLLHAYDLKKQTPHLKLL